MLYPTPDYIDAVNAERRNGAAEYRRAKMVMAAQHANKYRPQTAHRIAWAVRRLVVGAERR